MIYVRQMIWIVTALAVILTDVDTGLYLGVAFSLMTVIFRTQRQVFEFLRSLLSAKRTLDKLYRKTSLFLLIPPDFS